MFYDCIQICILLTTRNIQERRRKSKGSSLLAVDREKFRQWNPLVEAEILVAGNVHGRVPAARGQGRAMPRGVRSFPSWEGDGNVMQMGFYGENFRRRRNGEESRRMLGGVARRGMLWNQSTARLPPPRTAPRDRPRGRIIFTEIKSKIRLALKCAPDRARLESPVAQPRRNKEREG